MNTLFKRFTGKLVAVQLLAIFVLQLPALAVTILMVGPPGSGKGTQGQYLSDTFHIPQIAVGDILARERDAKTPLGLELAEFMKKGTFPPEPGEVSTRIFERIKEVLRQDQYKNGFIIDGIRNEYHATQFDKILHEIGQHLDAVVSLEVDSKVLLERLGDRYVCKNCNAIYNRKSKPAKIDGVCDYCQSHDLATRVDDQESETMARRISIFESKKAGLLDYYKDRHVLIKASDQGSAKKTYQFVLAKLVEKGLSTAVVEPKLEQHFTTTQSPELKNYFEKMDLTGKTVIEIGFGAGDLARHILKQNPAHIIGYEVDPTVVRHPDIEEQVKAGKIEIRYRDFRSEDFSFLNGGNSDNYVLITNPPYSLTPDIKRWADHYGLKKAMIFTSPQYRSLCGDMSVLLELKGFEFSPPARGNHLVLIRGWDEVNAKVTK